MKTTSKFLKTGMLLMALSSFSLFAFAGPGDGDGKTKKCKGKSEACCSKSKSSCDKSKPMPASSCGHKGTHGSTTSTTDKK